MDGFSHPLGPSSQGTSARDVKLSRYNRREAAGSEEESLALLSARAKPMDGVVIESSPPLPPPSVVAAAAADNSARNSFIAAVYQCLFIVTFTTPALALIMATTVPRDQIPLSPRGYRMLVGLLSGPVFYCGKFWARSVMDCIGPGPEWGAWRDVVREIMELEWAYMMSMWYTLFLTSGYTA